MLQTLTRKPNTNQLISFHNNVTSRSPDRYGGAGNPTRYSNDSSISSNYTQSSFNETYRNDSYRGSYASNRSNRPSNYLSSFNNSVIGSNGSPSPNFTLGRIDESYNRGVKEVPPLSLPVGNQENRSVRFKQPKASLKRSSSETELIKDANRFDDSLTPGKLFKSKSTRSFKNGKVVRTFMKNKNTIRLYDSVPHESMPPLHITNQEEVKKKFLESKIPPVLKFKADRFEVQNILKNYSKPNYQHFFKAKYILDMVKSKYPGGVYSYYEANFGKKITSKDCVDIVGKYLTDNKISGDLTINFAPGLTCAGRITSHGLQKNKPETRKFVVWINDGAENQFLRREGIICLLDHEIGTHYYRAYNEGLQVWFADRRKFGLRPLNSNELLKTEEGLAALHTLMSANLDYLFLPALLYYLACMGGRMTFEQLFNHMERYVELPDERWKLVTRVKRGISDPNAIGCYARDQSYFEGAIEILENLDRIDFHLLMSGKICVDELERVKRVARTDCIRTPKFFTDMKRYKDRLYKIGVCNGILGPNRPKVSKLAIMGSPRNFIDDSQYDYRPRQSNRTPPLMNKPAEIPPTNRGFGFSNNTSMNPNSNKKQVNSSKGIMDFNGYTTGVGAFSKGRGDYQANDSYDFSYATSSSGDTSGSGADANGAATTRSVKPIYNKDGRVVKRALNESQLTNNRSISPYDLNAYPHQISPKGKGYHGYDHDEINNYISQEIAANSKHPITYKPKVAVNSHDNSSLCVLL